MKPHGLDQVRSDHCDPTQPARTDLTAEKILVIVICLLVCPPTIHGVDARSVCKIDYPSLKAGVVSLLVTLLHYSMYKTSPARCGGWLQIPGSGRSYIRQEAIERTGMNVGFKSKLVRSLFGQSIRSNKISS